VSDMSDEMRAARDRSMRAAAERIEQVRRDATNDGLCIVVSVDGHHWQFRDVATRKLVLSYWPASAKAQRPGGRVTRCRGHYAALHYARSVMRAGTSSGEVSP